MARQQQTGPAQIAAAMAQKANRALFDFEVPEEIQSQALEEDGGYHDVVTITCRVLTPLEEKTAIKRANNEMVQIAYELAMACLVSVTVTTGRDPDGQPVGFEEKATEGRSAVALAIFNKLHPKVRDLVSTAYIDLHKAREDQARGFLESRKVRV